MDLQLISFEYSRWPPGVPTFPILLRDFVLWTPNINGAQWEASQTIILLRISHIFHLYYIYFILKLPYFSFFIAIKTRKNGAQRNSITVQWHPMRGFTVVFNESLSFHIPHLTARFLYLNKTNGAQRGEFHRWPSFSKFLISPESDIFQPKFKYKFRMFWVPQMNGAQRTVII